MGLKFKEVSYNNLRLGTKYIITDPSQYVFTNNKVYVGIFNGYGNNYRVAEITNWEKIHITYSPFTPQTKKYKVGDVSFNKYAHERTYLVLDSQRIIIQNNMESRSLNIILRRLIGDNSFYY